MIDFILSVISVISVSGYSGFSYAVIDPITLSIIAGAAVSAIAGGASAVSSYKAAKKANKTNKQIADESNELTYKMFKEGNLFNHDEAQLAFDREFDAAKYTTQRQQMLDAGLNPAMMFGEGNVTSPANSSAASSLGVPSIVTPTMQPEVLDFGSVSDLASAFKSLADARKAGAETKSIESLLNEQIKDLQLRNEYQEILNNYQGKKSANEIAKMLQDIEKGYVEIDNLIKEGKLTEAQIRLTKVQEEIGQEDKGLKKADRELREALSEKRQEYTQNILNQQKAETKKTQQEGNAAQAQGEAAKQNAATNAAVGNAQAGYYAEQAKDLRESRKVRIENLRSDSRHKNSLAAINEYDLDTRPSKIVASWHNFVDMCTATVSSTTSVKYLQKELDLIGKQVELAAKNNDYYLVNQLISNAKDIAIGIASVAVAYKGIGGRSSGSTTNGFTVTPVR